MTKEIINKINRLAFVDKNGYGQGSCEYEGKYICSFPEKFGKKLPRKGIFFIKNEYCAFIDCIRVNGINYQIPDNKLKELGVL